jgi:hypothetical protein
MTIAGKVMNKRCSGPSMSVLFPSGKVTLEDAPVKQTEGYRILQVRAVIDPSAARVS